MFSPPELLEFVWVTSLSCNANCVYCFQSKDRSLTSLEDAKKIVIKLSRFLEKGTRFINIYFQGGEAMELPPEWYSEVIDFGSRVLGRGASWHFQTNLIGYNSDWGDLLKKYFKGNAGSSLDWPNLYRQSGPYKGEDFNKIWKEKFDMAKEDGIGVGAISLPNKESIRRGPEAFLNYYKEMGLNSIQLNYLFSGVRRVDDLPEPSELGRFVVAVMEMAKAINGFEVAPYSKLLNCFSGRGFKHDFCIHSPSCSLNFISVRPNGMASLCDCWVAYSPDNRRYFGNFITDSIDDILNHPNRINFMERAFKVVSRECKGCEYLPFCHGGCPVRAFKNKGNMFVKDFYCDAYKIVFEYIKKEVRSDG